MNIGLGTLVILELLYFLVALIIFYWSHNIFLKYPIDPNSSDIIPSLQLYVKRFLSGIYPYLPMNFGAWTVQPNYFPMRWLPFIPAEILKFDYRFIPILCMLGFVYYIRGKNYFSRKINLANLLTPIVPYFILILILKYLETDFSLSTEFLIVFFYLFLAYSLDLKQPIVIAFSISLCLMSRYTIVFWLLFYLYYYCIIESKQSFIKLLFYIVLFCSIIYGPYVIYDQGHSFIEGMKYYEISARGIWNISSWQSKLDIPHHLNHGLNFSIYSYNYFYPNIERAYQFMKYIQLILIGVLLLIYVLLFKNSKFKMEDNYLGLLLSLKIYLILFYTFFTAPFPYLFFVPLCLNILIVNRMVK